MKIGLDLRMLGGGSGISRYIGGFSHEVLKNDKKNQYVLFVRNSDQAAAYSGYGHKIVIADIGHYSWAEQLKFPGLLGKENLDLVHFPHFNVPLMYRKPFVVTIHDLTHTKYPGDNQFRLLHRLAYRLTIANAAKKSRKVIAISNAVKNEIIEYFNIAQDKVEVIYEAANPFFHMIEKEQAKKEVIRKFGLDNPYILFVGVWRRYKNLPALAQAFDKLRDKGLNFDLVLAGEEDPFYPEIKSQILTTKHVNSVRMLNKVTDDELLHLYNAADLFVLPSLTEGFGLTPLEAAACGVPVVCSDIPVLREVMGAGSEFFDPFNISNMADVMEGLLRNPTKAEDLANAGLRRTQHFSWKKTAEATINLYKAAT